MSQDTRKLSTPKHTQVYERIRRQIDSGGLKIGDKLPSYSEMRREYGVHTNTSEKVFARLEVEGLIERQNGVGIYVADRAPRNPRSATLTVGLSGLGFGFASLSSYWSDLNEGIRFAAEQSGVRLAFLNKQDTIGWHETDGVILCEFDGNKYPRFVPAGKPCVSILSSFPGMASVSVDDHACGQILTDHLLSLGHRRIAYLHGQWGKVSVGRYRGYKDAYLKHGLEKSPLWSRKLTGQYEYGTDFVRSGHDSMAQWLRDGWLGLGCTALLTHNDETAIGAIKALHEAGLKVPGDVSVAGIDGMSIGAYLTPSLTTIELPLRDVGRLAMEKVLSQIADGKISDDRTVLPVRLRVNQSSRRLGTGNL